MPRFRRLWDSPSIEAGAGVIPDPKGWKPALVRTFAQAEALARRVVVALEASHC